MMSIKTKFMDINSICKYVPSFAQNYYIVYDGQGAGIYTDHDIAEESAWHSTERVDILKTRDGAIRALKRYHQKLNTKR